jgi:hypothetical protein
MIDYREQYYYYDCVVENCEKKINVCNTLYPYKEGMQEIRNIHRFLSSTYFEDTGSCIMVTEVVPPPYGEWP